MPVYRDKDEELSMGGFLVFDDITIGFPEQKTVMPKAHVQKEPDAYLAHCAETFAVQMCECI
jgi:hypothetical protein